MGFISIVIIMLLVHFLIIRPLTQRKSSRHDGRNNRRLERSRVGGEYGHHMDTSGTGIAGIGSFAGGMAAGALLAYLLDQGRIDFDQFQHLQQLEDNEAIQELMDQNIIQEDEINDLQEQLGNEDYHSDYEDGNYEDYGDNDDGGSYDDSWGGFDSGGGGDSDGSI